MHGKYLIGAALALAMGAGAGTAEPVKVGLISTLSGGAAATGVDVRDGFLLAVKGQADKVTVIVEDDQLKPDVGVQLADKLIQSDRVDLLTGIMFSNVAMAVVPAVTGQGKFYLSPNAGPSPLAGARCHPLYFNVAWQNDSLHEGGGAYAKSAGYKNVFILAPNYPAGTDALTGFKRLYGGTLANEVYTQLGQTDYAGEIAQIRASGADAVYFFLPGGMGVSFVKQYAGSGVDIPLIGPAFSFDQTILGAVGDAALGVRNTSQWSPDMDNAANREFVAAFQAEYGRLPSLYASQAYDTGRLLLSAIAKADVGDKDAFRAALAEADFESVRGNFRFNTNQHPIHDIFVREVVKDGDVITNRLVGQVLSDHADVYAAECKY